MITVNVKTSDSQIWNTQEVYKEISRALLSDQDLTIDLCSEGPDFSTLGIHEYLVSVAVECKYDLKRVIIKTNNLIEEYSECTVEKSFPIHLINNTSEYYYNSNIDKNLKHFGYFVGRGNAPRLYLSSYLYKNHPNKIIHTNHLDLDNNFYAANIGIERLLTEYNINDITTIAEYLNKCPITEHRVQIDKSLSQNPAQQLLKNDKQSFLKKYDSFAIEIVSETYFTGDTFFPTEKTWRPILLKKPFIVQGPVNYLKNLKKLGFKTFDQWWDEGYDEDPPNWSIHEITKLIDNLSGLSTDDLHQMYKEMQSVLDHNYKTLSELTTDNLEKVFVNYKTK